MNYIFKLNKIYRYDDHKHLKIHINIEELSNCTDTNYDSSIGKWYINVHNEPYCDIPHFHIINENLKFDSRILLFESKYLGNKFHQYDLSEQQRIFNSIKFVYVTFVMINGATVWLIWSRAVSVDIGVLTQGSVVALINYMSQILVELIKLANLIITITKSFCSTYYRRAL